MTVNAVQSLLPLTPNDVKPYLHIPVTYTDIDALLDDWIDEAKEAADAYMNHAFTSIPRAVRRGVIEWVRMEYTHYRAQRDLDRASRMDPEYADARPRRNQAQVVKRTVTAEGETVEYFNPNDSLAVSKQVAPMSAEDIRCKYWCKYRIVCF